MKKIFLPLLFAAALFADPAPLIDLEDMSQDFVLETKRVEIPGYPYAFNPAIIRWQGFILMSFRVIPDPKTPFTSQIGLILLDENFSPIGEPQILKIRPDDSSVPCRAEDARLLYLQDKLLIVYSDNPEEKLSAGGFRMVIGEIDYAWGQFSIKNSYRLLSYEGEKGTLREKNWVPFEFGKKLCLAYSLNPHLIFSPLSKSGVCKTIASTTSPIEWDWGILRGGTPAERIDAREYLSFFHSVKSMETANSNGRKIAHYFIGAYTFQASPPFTITRFSPEPIVGKGFYSGVAYKPYWGSIQCVFPTGMIIDGNTIWISYGRQDHEIWVVKLDKRKLLASLIPVGRDG